MFRSAIVAVLAVALSSSIAAAQPADHQTEVDFLSDIGFDITPPEPLELASVAFELSELVHPAAQDSPDSFASEAAFLKKAEWVLVRNLDRAQDFMKKARLNAVNLLTSAQTQPRFGLYATQGALQALDILTTHRALNAGHTEANPLFKSGNRTGMILAKSASFGLHVYLTERLAERRPKTAKWLMVATNAFMSIVVVNNLAVGDAAAQ